MTNCVFDEGLQQQVRDLRVERCRINLHVDSETRSKAGLFDVEVLALAKAWGYEIREIPVRWRDDGDTRLELFRGNVRNVIDLCRIRASLAGVAPEEAKSVAAFSGRR